MEPEITQELIDACEHLLDISGGSKLWQGETEIAFKRIEKAVARANKLMERANRKEVKDATNSD